MRDSQVGHHREMLPRRLSRILQLPEPSRFTILAEGAEMLAENVETLAHDATTLGETRRDRGAAVLRSFAEEEAAKVLILLDIARAGWADTASVGKLLKAFYNHLARGLYVQAYDGRPASLQEVREYVDALRQEYYLDGPMDVDWILGNQVTTQREESLYVDYIENEHGDRFWTGPEDRVGRLDASFSYPTPVGEVVRLVAAMRRVGLLTEQGFAATREAWSGVTVTDATHWSQLEPVNADVLNRLADRSGQAYMEADAHALGIVRDRWNFPLSTLDLELKNVKLEDLEHRRVQRLAAEEGFDYWQAGP